MLKRRRFLATLLQCFSMLQKCKEVTAVNPAQASLSSFFGHSSFPSYVPVVLNHTQFPGLFFTCSKRSTFNSSPSSLQGALFILQNSISELTSSSEPALSLTYETALEVSTSAPSSEPSPGFFFVDSWCAPLSTMLDFVLHVG